MATKPISKKDLDIFGDKLKRTVERAVDQKVVLEVGKAKEEILDEQRKFLNELHNTINGLVSEVRDSQEFREITTGQIVEDRERIGRLEKKVFGAAAV